MAQDLAVEVRTIRNRLGLTQEGLADRLGVSYVTVNRWETGKAAPRSRSRTMLARLADETPLVPEPGHKAFRPVQYLGSKLRLLDHIEQAVVDSCTGPDVVDLFTGSGVVANSLAQRFRVIATDIQQYSCDLAKALLLSTGQLSSTIDERIDEIQGLRQSRQHRELFGALISAERDALSKAASGDLGDLLDFSEAGSLTRFLHDPGQSAIPTYLRDALKQTRHAVQRARRRNSLIGQIALLYGGTYFSYEQAVVIDAIRFYLHQAHLGSSERIVLMGALLSAASHVANTVGKQFAQPMRLRKRDGTAKTLLVQRTLRDRSLPVFEAMRVALHQIKRASPLDEQPHEVVRADYRDFLSSYAGSPSCFYADPPYTIDHYSRFYHVLETIACGDAPQLDQITRAGKRQLANGIYRSDRHQSPFCIPSRVRSAFKALFEGVRRFDAPLILSYSPFAQESGRPRLLALDELQELATEYFSDVTLRFAGAHRHRKLHWNTAPVTDDPSAEVLLVCLSPVPSSHGRR